MELINEKLIVLQLFRKMCYVKPEGSLACSQESAISYYPKPD